MSEPAIHELDPTLHQANIWLKEVMQRLKTEDAHIGHAAMRAALHALRDRIGPENAAHLGAQLPTIIRGIYYESWHPSGTPTKERRKQQFLDHVRSELRSAAAIDPEAATSAVFDVVCQNTSVGEGVKLARLFPKEMRALWPAEVQAKAGLQDHQDQGQA